MLYDKWIRDWKTALAENFFLRSLCLFLAIGLILNATVFKSNDRVVIVPPQVTKQFWIESKRAAPEYLEQMGMFFAMLGGNLSPENAEYNVSLLIHHIGGSSGTSDAKADLAAQALYIKKNNITQSFYPSAVNVDPEYNTVTIEGEVIRNIGTTKISREKMFLRMKFYLENYKLWLQEFYTEYPGRDKKAAKEEREELEKAKNKLIEQKPLVRKYWTTAGELTQLMASDEVWISYTWGGLMLNEAKKLNLPVAEFMPKEGADGWVDNWMIVKDSPNQECAYKYINFMMSPKGQCGVSTVTGYSASNPVAAKTCMSAEEFAAKHQDDVAYVKQLHMWQTPERIEVYTNVWIAVNAAP